VKFEDVKVKRSQAGKAGANKRWQMLSNDSKPNQSITKIAVNDNVNVNVISKDIYRSFAHLSITNNQVEKLMEKYSIEAIDAVLDSIENYKGNKNYVSLHLTAAKWLAKNNKTQQVEEPSEMQILRQYAKKQG